MLTQSSQTCLVVLVILISFKCVHSGCITYSSFCNSKLKTQASAAAHLMASCEPGARDAGALYAAEIPGPSLVQWVFPFEGSPFVLAQVAGRGVPPSPRALLKRARRWRRRSSSDQSRTSWPRRLHIARSRAFRRSPPACGRNAPVPGETGRFSAVVLRPADEGGLAAAASGWLRTGGAFTGFPGAAARAVGLTAGCGETCALASCSGGMRTACFATGSPLLKAFFGTAVVAMVLYA